jgi:hypothetical protein
MPEKEPKKESISNNGPNTYAKFTGLAFQMIAIIGSFAYLGYRIDDANNHQVKWATAGMALAGVFISLYVVFKSLKN